MNLIRNSSLKYVKGVITLTVRRGHRCALWMCTCNVMYGEEILTNVFNYFHMVKTGCLVLE